MPVLSPLDKFLWAVVGLLLTITGVFIEVAVPMPSFTWPIQWSQMPTYSLGVTLQVGAILLIGCLGGKEAASLSQVAYLVLGLSGFKVFAQGGGLFYLKEPTFGYLLGFLPAAWICGHLAFQASRRIETLIRSCLLGLLTIHGVGLAYLTILSVFRLIPDTWWTSVLRYSLYPLPGQFIVVCTAAVLAYLLRIVLFY